MRIIFALLIVITLQNPASALVVDPSLHSQLQQKRWELIVRESNLVKEKSSLEETIDDLNRKNERNRYDIQINQLSRDLARTHADLRDIRLDIRDVERALNS